jgi:glycosyltransferase involved in cell wall biosynthesis
MKITVLSHNLSSNAVMRAHRVAVAARHFAEVKLIGSAEENGPWPALPRESWIQSVEDRRLPKFYKFFLELVDLADGDVLIAVKPQFSSFGAALIAGERRGVPVILDLDDWDAAFTPRSRWAEDPLLADPRRQASAVYVSLFTKAIPAAAAVTVSSCALQQKFGGVLLRHGALTELFDPAGVDRDAARKEFGFTGPTVLFAGTPREHKGILPLAAAVARVPGACLAVTCRPEDLSEPEWASYPLLRVPIVPYPSLPRLLAAADLVAIPQLDSEAARYQMPMKVYDCMAMGKPIVASAISDLPEVLDGCARLVPAGDVEHLATAINDFLDQPDKARALGERARMRCLEQFSMKHVGATLQEVVQSVLPVSG